MGHRRDRHEPALRSRRGHARSSADAEGRSGRARLVGAEPAAADPDAYAFADGGDERKVGAAPGSEHVTGTVAPRAQRAAA